MKRIAVVLVSLMVVACSSAPKKDTSQVSQPDTKNPPVVSNVPDQAKLDAEALASLKPSVYFDFQKSVVPAEYDADIQKQSEYIKSHKADAVTLEGNCDERGSSEYNLGLGQRRAEAVKHMLVAAGVPEGQVKAASQGKEKPKLQCHEEKCWKENRRVDFVRG